MVFQASLLFGGVYGTVQYSFAPDPDYCRNGATPAGVHVAHAEAKQSEHSQHAEEQAEQAGTGGGEADTRDMDDSAGRVHVDGVMWGRRVHVDGASQSCTTPPPHHWLAADG